MTSDASRGGVTGERPPVQADTPSVELDLKATAKQVFLAIAEVVQRSGCTLEVVQPARPPDLPCRVAARRMRPPASMGSGPGPASDERGPVQMMYEFRDVGGGHVRVRITQSGFGDQANWDAAFGTWGGSDGSIPWQPLPGRPGDRPAFPVDFFPPPGAVPGRSVHDPVVAALVQKIEAACARLNALRREHHSPGLPAEPPR